MTAGPCCVFRATAPPANDGPPDVVAREGAASNDVACDEVLDEELDEEEELDKELPIAKIISHRDTRGQPNDPVLAYYTVRFEGLEDPEEAEDELPEEELLRRAPKLLRSYRRDAADAADAAAKAASQGVEATCGASARPHRGRKAARSGQGRGGGAEASARGLLRSGRRLRRLGVHNGTCSWVKLASRSLQGGSAAARTRCTPSGCATRPRRRSGARRPGGGGPRRVGRRWWGRGVDGTTEVTMQPAMQPAMKLAAVTRTRRSAPKSSCSS